MNEPNDPTNIKNEKSINFSKKIQREVYTINCQSIIEWDENEIRNAKRLLFKLKGSQDAKNSVENNHIALLPDSNYIFDQSMCSLFRELRGYDTNLIHDFELSFPLAFSILTYNNVEQFERLLRSIYR